MLGDTEAIVDRSVAAGGVQPRGGAQLPGADAGVLLSDRFGGLRNGGFLAHRSPQGAKMRQKSNSDTLSSEQIVKGIRRATRKRYSAEEKIRIVLDGLRGEQSIAELCRREGIAVCRGSDPGQPRDT